MLYERFNAVQHDWSLAVNREGVRGQTSCILRKTLSLPARKVQATGSELVFLLFNFSASSGLWIPFWKVVLLSWLAPEQLVFA